MSGELQYLIRHTSRFAYSAPITESTMEVHMQPRGDGRQRCLRFELTTQPRARVFAYQDSLGNVVHHFDIPSRHSRLWVTADAIVEMAHAATLPESLPDRVWDDLDEIAVSGERWHSLQPSQFARETPLLAALAEELVWQRDADPLTLMRRLNYALFHSFTYAQSETHVDSPIDDALKARAGVCQDLAHIMIALARRIGIPCRYVSGYLSPSSDSHDRSAEGATHAWTEAYLPTLGWVGFDPTNDVLAAERHIRVAVGRDYADVPPTRGVFRGEAGSVLAVLVTVSLSDSPIRPERVMPMTTWVTPEVAEPPEDFDHALQQQQEQQQQ
jgi:transglutaminase-like putative cysteine protease